MGKHRRGGVCVGQRIVRTDELYAVSRANVGEAVRQLALWVEGSREAQCAQWLADGQRHSLALCGTLEEGGVERCIVGDEPGPVQPLCERGEDFGRRWGVADIASADAVQPGGADAVPPAMAWVNEA